MKKIKIVGATGYAGGETIRILMSHPDVEVVAATFDGKEPVALVDFYPQLRGQTDLTVQSIEKSGEVESGLDLVFMAVPDNVAHNLTPQYLKKSVKVVDFSGDFRFKDNKTHHQWYGFDVESSLLAQAVYGMPELFRERIKGAEIIGNPGCYPTCCLLGLAPAIKKNMVDAETVICDAKSSISGAGRNSKTFLHFPERNENFSAYKIASHRHNPEIEYYAAELSQQNVTITFVPHLMPINRGMLCTIYADLISDITEEQVRAQYEKFYKEEPFVRILPKDVLPSVNTVAGTNFCDIHVTVDEHANRLVIVSLIDNLVKGASGQAIQNMNILLGLDETAGLMVPGQYL